MKILRQIIAAVFFAVAGVLAIVAIRTDSLIWWLLSIVAISVAIVIDDNNNNLQTNREAQQSQQS